MLLRYLPPIGFRLTIPEKGTPEKGTDLFFYSKTMRGVRIRVRKINLSPFCFVPFLLSGGATLCGAGLGLGCALGGGTMAVFGGGNIWEGGTGFYSHFATDELYSYNPVKEVFNSLPGGYGPVVYSGVDLAAAAGAGFVKVPLKMGLSDGLDRSKSIFGVLVKSADNNYFLPVLNARTPYGTAGAVYLFGVGRKGYDFGGVLSDQNLGGK